MKMRVCGCHSPDAQSYGFSVRVRKKDDASYNGLYDLLDDEFYLWSNAVSIYNMQNKI